MLSKWHINLLVAIIYALVMNFTKTDFVERLPFSFFLTFSLTTWFGLSWLADFLNKSGIIVKVERPLPKKETATVKQSQNFLHLILFAASLTPFVLIVYFLSNGSFADTFSRSINGFSRIGITTVMCLLLWSLLRKRYCKDHDPASSGAEKSIQ